MKRSNKKTSVSRRQLLSMATVALASASCSAITGKSNASASGSARAGKGGGGPKFPVDVYPVEARRVPFIVTADGTLDAFEHVQITARVAGPVDKVSFAEGQAVKKGDVLVTIDSERFQSTLNSARAAVAKAVASQKDAEDAVARRKAANDQHPGLIAGEEISTYETKASSAKADSETAQEAVRAAELNVRDSQVVAPMDGVVQTRTIETGQYVQTGYLMATLVQADPLLLRFPVYPLDAPRVLPGMSVDFTLKEKPETVFHAKITLVDAAADDSTHMVGVTAQVDTEQNKHWLRPGSFADVTLNVGGSRDYVIIPGSAIRGSDKGEIAFVVVNGVAQQRVLTTGETTKDGFVEVRAGLKAGEKLVIRGQQPLVDGSLVTTNDVPAPESTAIPADSASAAPAASGSAAPSASASASAKKPGKGAP